MPELFKCPACGAPLEYKGTSFQKCEFCGNTVIVPTHELQPAPEAGDGQAPLRVRQLIAEGKLIEAIKVYRELTGVGLKEAKDAVEAIRDGRPAVSVQVFTVSSTSSAVPPNAAEAIEKIKQLAASGNKIEAVKVFRETFGTGLAQSKNGVELLAQGNVPIERLLTMTSSGQLGPGVGRSIVLGLMIVGFIGVAIAVAVTYFVSSTVQRAIPNFPSAPTPGKVVTTSKSSAATPSIAEELLRIGGEGLGGGGKFKDNRVVAVAADGKIYSADYQGGRVQAFGADGQFLTQFTVDETRTVGSIAVDRKDNLYVQQGYDIYKVNRETGAQLGKFRVDNASCFALSVDGKLYVARSFSTIAVLNADGRQERTIDPGKNLDLSMIEAIAVDTAGNVVVVDGRTGTIFRLAPDGKLLARFGGRGAANGSAKTRLDFTPHGLAIDSAGRIYAGHVSAVSIFDGDGNQLGRFDEKQAFGVTLDQDGNLYVASRPFVVKYKLSL